MVIAEKVIVEVPISECVTSKNKQWLSGLPDYSDMIRRRLPDHTISLNETISWEIGGRWFHFKIHDIIPSSIENQIYQIDCQSTNIEIKTIRTRSEIDHNMDISENELLNSLKDMIRSSFDHITSFHQLCIPVAKSALIHGVSGVGKTTLVKQASQYLDCELFEISIQKLLALKDEWQLKQFNNYNPLHLILNKAMIASPSIVLIKDLNSIGKENDRLLDIIHNEMNRIPDSEKVFVIGTARHLQSLPERLKKVDIFKQHLAYPIPTMPQRKSLLKSMLSKMDLVPVDNMGDDLEYYITQISLRTSGFVARDLKMICRNATLKSMRKKKLQSNNPDDDNNNTTDQLVNDLSKLKLEDESKNGVDWSDFEYALDNYQASQQMDIDVSLPKRSWNDIGGYDVIKKRIRQSTLLPLLQPEIFTRLGISPPSGLLLYGPSGCGKTMMIQAVASESMMNVISINGPEIFSKYLGETELKIRQLFATAKRISPCLIFIDEMDAIGSRRGWDSSDSSGGVNERVLSTLLNEMDGVEGRQGVIVIGCTNRPHQIDDAILRPGRLDQLIYVGMPTEDDRKDIIEQLKKKIKLDDDIDIDELSKKTNHCTGADIEYLFREAGTIALRENIDINGIHRRHINQIIDSVCERAQKQIDDDILAVYAKFQNDHSL
ncbi:unnamed protein product [Cunninghamella blakesleeana]